MARKFSERICIVCGKKWTVEDKSKNYKRCMCDDCLKTLSIKEKQKYYRLNSSSYIVEERECLNCGKKWQVATAKNRVGIRKKKHFFCNECCSILSTAEKKRIMKDKVEGYRQKMYEEKRRERINNVQRYLWQRAKQRAIKYNLDFNIEQSDIIVPKICPILEVPLEWGKKGNYEYSPSLDRIDNNKGYIKGNIMVISKKANTMKNSASIQELKTFCKNILRYSLNNSENETIEQ